MGKDGPWCEQRLQMQTLGLAGDDDNLPEDGMHYFAPYDSWLSVLSFPILSPLSFLLRRHVHFVSKMAAILLLLSGPASLLVLFDIPKFDQDEARR